MLKHRIYWLLCWLASLIFLIFYQQWLAWLFLGAVLLIPLFSLLVSLPAMVTARLDTTFPERLEQHTNGTPRLECRCPFITPHWSCRIRITNSLTGSRWQLRPGDALPTDQCGMLRCSLKGLKVYDYLGLFSLPLRGDREHQVVVEPTPIPIPTPEAADADTFSWKPKNGGFSENHELRLYAPGDSLRQIHWKLSAKTGKLIIREPMVPDPGKVLVQLELKGDPETLQRLLGRTLWLGNRLLEQQVPFVLLCLTGEGPERFQADTPEAFRRAMDTILGRTPTEGALSDRTETATHLYILGGDPDEA